MCEVQLQSILAEERDSIERFLGYDNIFSI